MANKYFKVTCKCGHVGIKYFIRISFPIVATCGKDASSIARYIPRVKHDHKDAILDCKEISYNEYLELQIINNNDPYLKCACKQEQEMIDNFSSRLELEPRLLKKENVTVGVRKIWQRSWEYPDSLYQNGRAHKAFRI